MSKIKKRTYLVALALPVLGLLALVLNLPTLAAPSLFPNEPEAIGDLVWYDTDQDGIQDAGEPGVQSIFVEFYDTLDCSGMSPYDSDTTDASGIYSITTPITGVGCIQFSNIPAGWSISPQDQGADDTVDSDVDPATAQITNIVFFADHLDNDMGIYAEGSIGDTVWCDTDGDDLYDAGEGVAGVTVDLYQDTDCDTNPNGAIFRTQDTVGDGQYSFTPLSIGPPGGSPVCYYAEVDVADMGACNNPITPISYAVSLEANSPDDLTADFGFNQQLLASIGDYVWQDDNQDGIQNEVGTGIAGVTMNLYDCASPGTPLDSTGTDASGNYSFVDLVPGDYFVECVPPANYTISPQDQGADDAADSDADPVTGQTVCTTLDPGENDPTWDCGMFQTGSAIQIDKEVSANGWIAPNVPSVAYTLTVTNIGAVTLNPVAVTDDLDPGLTFVPGSATPPETSVVGQQIYWADITGGAGMAPAASTQIVFQVTGPITPGLYNNFALAEGTPPVGGIVSATASVSLLVEDPSLSIDKTLTPPGTVGDLVTFTIYVENTGPSAIDVLPLYDTFSGPAILSTLSAIPAMAWDRVFNPSDIALRICSISAMGFSFLFWI